MTHVNHHTGGHIEIDSPGFWTLLFGVFYFAHKGCWRTFTVAFLLCLCTMGAAWLVLPFFAGSLLAKELREKGYTELIPETPPQTARPSAAFASLRSRLVERTVLCPLCSQTLLVPANTTRARCENCQDEFNPAQLPDTAS